MDYKEKYEKALNKAKEIYFRNDATDGGKIILEGMFPELKESEDERIRKMLIRIFKKADMGGEIFGEGISYKQVIAWLEKQAKEACKSMEDEQ